MLNRNLAKRVDALEARQKAAARDEVVQAISELIDELSAIAAGGDGTPMRSELLDLLGGDHVAP